MMYQSTFAFCRRHSASSSLAILFRLALGTVIATAPVLRAEAPDFSNDPEIRPLLRQAALLEAQNAVNKAKTTDLEVLAQIAALQANLATSQATVATQNKAADEASYGARLTPLSGTVSSTTAAEAMVIVNNQINQIAGQIALDMALQESIPSNSSITLIPGDAGSPLQAGMRAYGQIISELAITANQLEKPHADLETYLKGAPKVDTPKDPTALALDTVGGGIQAALSLAAMARVNRTFTPAEVKVEDMALVSALAGHLINPAQGTIAATSSAKGGSAVVETAAVVETKPSKQYSKVYSVGLIGGTEDLVKRINKIASLVASTKAVLGELENREKQLTGVIATFEKKKAVLSEGLEKARREVAVNQSLVNYWKKIVDAGGSVPVQAEKPGEPKPEGAREIIPGEEFARVDGELKGAQDREKEVGNQLTDLEAEQSPFDTAKKALADLQGKLKELKAPVVAPLGRAEEYLKAIVAGSIGGVKLEELLKAGAIKSRLGHYTEKEGTWVEDSSAFLVFVHVNSVAGTNLARQTLLHNSFRVAGGASVSYHVVKPDFSSVLAATYYDYDGFFKVDDRVIGGLPGNLPNDTPIVRPAERKRRGPLGPPGKR